MVELKKVSKSIYLGKMLLILPIIFCILEKSMYLNKTALPDYLLNESVLFTFPSFSKSFLLGPFA